MILPAIPLTVAWRSLSIQWVWFPATYLVIRTAARIPSHEISAHDLACCLVAVAAAVLVVAGSPYAATRSSAARATAG